MHAVSRHCLLLRRRCVAKDRTKSRSRFEELCCFITDHAQVIFLVNVGIATIEQLQYFTLRNGIGGIRQYLHDAHIVHFHHHLKSTGV
jgi:hypothetical protein